MLQTSHRSQFTQIPVTGLRNIDSGSKSGYDSVIMGNGESSGLSKLDQIGENSGCEILAYPLLMLFGIALSAASMYFSYQDVITRLWKETPCTITASRVTDGGNEYPWRFDVEYSYRYTGENFTGTVYQHRYEGTRAFRRAVLLHRRYPSGLSTRCFVKPSHPEQAVLVHGGLTGLALSFLPLGFSVVAYGQLRKLWKNAGSPKPAAKKTEESEASTTQQGIALCLFMAAFFAMGTIGLYQIAVKPC